MERQECMGVVVGRHINGITINPLEYLLDDMGELIVFRSEERAKEYFKGQGWTEEQIYWLVFEETESECNLD